MEAGGPGAAALGAAALHTHAMHCTHPSSHCTPTHTHQEGEGENLHTKGL